MCEGYVRFFGVVAFFEEEDGLGSEERNERFERKGRVVRRIEVDDVEEGGLFGEEREGAGGGDGKEGGLGGEIESGDVFFDAGEGGAVLLDEGGVRGAATEGFEGHGAAAGKEIEKAGSCDFVLADVEDGFAEHALSGTSGGAFGGFEEAAFKASGYDAESHRKATSKSYGERRASASARCLGSSSLAYCS